MEKNNNPPREGAKDVFTVEAYKKLASGKTSPLVSRTFETMEEAQAFFEAYTRPSGVRARCIVSLTQQWQEPGSRFLIHRLYKDLQVYREL